MVQNIRTSIYVCIFISMQEKLLLSFVFHDHADFATIISDFDGDNFVGPSDIEHAVQLLTQNELAIDEMESIWEKVI